MPLHGPIVAAINLQESDAPLREAHGLAEHLRARLLVCHVLPEAVRAHVQSPQDPGTVDPTLQAGFEQRAREAVAARIESATGRRAPDVEIVVDTGSPHAVILREAERVGAGLIVTGAGRAAWRVARYASCPTLVARPSPADGSVLGATDFSDPALPAVEAAVAEAARRHARLRLMHCLDVDLQAMSAMPGMTVPPMLPPGSYEALEEHATGHLKDSLQQFGATGDCIVWRGPAGPGIVAAARDTATALVVVGTRGRTGLKRVLLGSVAEEVMREAPCSVLVAPLGQSA